VPEKYTNEQVTTSLSALNKNLSPDEEWSLKNQKLCKTFKFKNFITAFGWMTQVAIWAEKLKHHPEWFNVYNRVEVELTTHDADGISELDFKLAAKMELLK
jgi:4a-hydroxytetrahydrobiopterin dehydratase